MQMKWLHGSISSHFENPFTLEKNYVIFMKLPSLILNVWRMRRIEINIEQSSTNEYIYTKQNNTFNTMKSFQLLQFSADLTVLALSNSL